MEFQRENGNILSGKCADAHTEEAEFTILAGIRHDGLRWTRWPVDTGPGQAETVRILRKEVGDRGLV